MKELERRREAQAHVDTPELALETPRSKDVLSRNCVEAFARPTGWPRLLVSEHAVIRQAAGWPRPIADGPVSKYPEIDWR